MPEWMRVLLEVIGSVALMLGVTVRVGRFMAFCSDDGKGE